MERQSLLKEIGNSKNMQYLIDKTQERFRPILWPNFFAWRNVPSISYETLIGNSGIGAAASVVSYDVAAPLRTRRHVKKLTGEVPSMREKFKMSERDFQDYHMMKAGLNADANAIMSLIFNDIKMASEAPHKRLDIFALEALSTGQITLDTTKNPDGIITESAIDFQMPAGNKNNCTALWSTGGSTSKPITDILAIVAEAEAIGVKLDRMFMRRSVFANMRKADEVKDYVTAWAIGKSTPKVNLTLNMVNEFFAAEGLPKIVLVEASIGIEKDGVITAYNPFDANNVAFTPAGLMGDMLNAPIMEKLHPVKEVAYAEYNRVLLKKWSSTDPLAEFTACELNAFPSWKNVDYCFILDTEDTG